MVALTGITGLPGGSNYSGAILKMTPPLTDGTGRSRGVMVNIKRPQCQSQRD